MSGSGPSPLLSGSLVDRSPASIHFRPTRASVVAYFSKSALEKFDEQVSVVRPVPKEDKDTQLVCYSDRVPRIVDDQVHVFRPISLLTASRPVLVGPRNSKVDVHLLFGVASPEKLLLMGVRAAVKFGTSLPRLSLDTRWTEFAVVSEPFVIMESVGYLRGYVPAIEVRVPNGQLYYLPLHAKSVCEIIETARSGFEHHEAGTIVGNIYRIRKKSEERAAGFEGGRVSTFGLDSARRGQLVARKPSRRMRRMGMCSECGIEVRPYHLVCPGAADDNCPMK